MKLSKFETFSNGLYEDPWHKLKQYTDERIAMGRVGCSIPTQELLNFQLSHAQAKDAVFHQLNIEDMQPQTENQHCATGAARYALEMNLGWFGKHQIQPGAKIEMLGK